MTGKLTTLKPQFVENMPQNLQDGILCISKKWKLAIHNCCCGCKNQVVTPLSATGWDLTVTDELVTLSPSIGNFRFECKSHYWIKNNKVEWC